MSTLTIFGQSFHKDCTQVSKGGCTSNCISARIFYFFCNACCLLAC